MKSTWIQAATVLLAGTITVDAFAQPKPQGTVQVFTTAYNTSYRLADAGTAVFTSMPQPVETQVCVFVDPSKKFQTFLGIGGALTDASAETFYKLPADKQDELLKAYFDKKNGIAYTVARTNINSCDFSSDMYTYVNEGDASLASFDIAHDKKYKIPFIKAAMKAAGGKLTLFASPWSPPAWMKTNNNMLQGGKLKPEFFSTWALYYTKFIKAYEKEGIPLWGISIQNEPMATQTWESCIYSAEEERDFLKNHLGPTMVKEGLAAKKIIVWDHNRDLMYQRAQTYFNDPLAAKYAWGIGFHWYEPWSGGTPMYDNVRLVNEAFPDKHIFFTEGCAESFNDSGYHNWKLGEKYSENMIQDFNNGMVGFTDWNILLDETGGPNHVGNFCFAPVHADTKTGALIYTNAYYYIGHFSKFIQPGAKRIACSASRSQLLSTAFVNPDGKTVVVVMNRSDKDTPYFLWVKGRAASITAKGNSLSTLIF
ncbi:MAG TPA: glycoside hydrolase family 30 protein [Ferruginibacter sp.]|nr:glycoside hydrolase family 30 protein [Ferruginibacter sp.]HMP19994.1 glycoside hydrolase family 30 protein [Ferruginibacter sp.]